MKKIIAFSISLIMMSLITFSGVRAATDKVYNIVTSLGENSSSEMNINYHADVLGTVVEYTLGTDIYFVNKTTITNECRTFSVDMVPYTTITVGFTERYVCESSITGLTENTIYRYRIKEGSNYSGVYTFKTAPTFGSTNFMFLTDPQFYSLSTAQAYNTLITEGLKQNPNIAFTMITGDITDRGGYEQQWDWFFEAGTNLTKMPLVTTPGNHEYYFDSGLYTSIDYYNAYFNNPKNGPEEYKNSTYFFKHNNGLFIMLDVVTGLYRNEQIEWFSEIIENNPSKYIIVGMHYGGFGSTYANVAEQILNSWGVVFDKYQVDLVLSGHDHIYARTAPIYNKVPSTLPGYGTTYIVGGAAGQKTYPITETAKPKFEFSMVSPNIGSIISLQGQSIVIKLINTSGVVLDEFSIPAKRPNIIQEIEQSEFIETINVIKDIPNNTAKLVWDGALGYGNVRKMELTNNFNQVKKDIFIPMPIATESSLGTIYLGTNHSYTMKVYFYKGDPMDVDINYSQKYGSTELSNLRIDSSSLMQDYVKLLWDEEESMGELDYYKVYLGSEYLGNVGKNVKQFEIEGLTKSTNYTVKIEGVDTFGDVAFEKTISFQTNEVKYPCGNVDNINVEFSVNSAQINWTNQLNLLGFGEFRVYLDGILVDTLDETSSSYSFANLLEDTEYTLELKTVDKYGDIITSNALLGKTLSSKIPAGTISQVRVEKSKIKHNSAIIEWNNESTLEGLNHYILYVNDIEFARPTKLEVAYEIKGLSANSTYTIKIVGIDMDGDEAFSEEVEIITIGNGLIVGAIVGGSVLGSGGLAAGVMLIIKRKRV